MKFEFKSVLFLGIGGVSMHQLALAFKDLGVKVFGYDAKANQYTAECEKKGIEVIHKFSKDFLNVDLCVKTGAIKDDNKFVKALNKLDCPIVDRADALGWLATKFKKVIAVAGTHGKSTTSALIYEMLRVAGRSVSCHIGADVFAPRFKIGDDYLVVEACEFNKSFLSLYPHISVVTNVEAEHMDSYGSLFNLRNAFLTFLKRAETRFVFEEDSTKFLKKHKNINFVGLTNLKLKPKLKGEHNMKNISLAIAVAQNLGIDIKVISQVVNSFIGVPRRYEFLGLANQTKIFIDYAHHPTEVKAFVETFLTENKDAMIVFQPHTYSRTKIFLKKFVEIFSKINNLIIFKEYPARENKECGLSAKELFYEIQKNNDQVNYCANEKSLKEEILNYPEVAFVGAGDVDLIARSFINK